MHGAFLEFLKSMKKSMENQIFIFRKCFFRKLLLNFTWWVNRKDKTEKECFGGFLGLDNIGAFDRNMQFKNGEYLEL